MTEKSLQVLEHTHVLTPGDVQRLQKPTPDHASCKRRDPTVRNSRVSCARESVREGRQVACNDENLCNPWIDETPIEVLWAHPAIRVLRPLEISSSPVKRLPTVSSRNVTCARNYRENQREGDATNVPATRNGTSMPLPVLHREGFLSLSTPTTTRTRQQTIFSINRHLSIRRDGQCPSQ
jgi:hypothetical protein